MKQTKYKDLPAEEKIEFLEQALDSVDELIFIKNRQSRLVWVNKRLCDLYNQKRDELSEVLEVQHVESKDTLQYVNADQKVFGHGKKLTIPSEVVASTQGQDHFFSTQKYPIRNKDNSIHYLIGISREIDNEHTLEALVDKRKNAFSLSKQMLALVSQMPAAFAVLNAKMEHLAYSDKWQKEVIGTDKTLNQTAITQFMLNDSTQFEDALLSAVKGDCMTLRSFEFKRANGTNDIMDLEIRPWFTLEGEIEGVLISSNIITKEIQAHAQVVAALEATDKALSVKNQFLSNMSHETRTPINGIMGTAKLLRGLIKDKEQLSLIETLEESGQALTNLIEDILHVSDIESHKTQLNNSILNTFDVIQDLENEFRPQFIGKNIKFVINKDINTSPALIADPNKLRKVLRSLLSNALKFTQSGEVELGIKPNPENKQSIIFYIKDTGIGIDENEQSRLFKPFEQSELGHNRRYGGSGLGLTIASEYVRIMGGMMNVRSTKGKGSLFEFSLPLYETNMNLPRFIIVEKNPIHIAIMKNSFEHFNMPFMIIDPNSIKSTEEISNADIIIAPKTLFGKSRLNGKSKIHVVSDKQEQHVRFSDGYYFAPKPLNHSSILHLVSAWSEQITNKKPTAA